MECGWLRSGSSARSIRVIPDGCVDVFVTADGVVMIAGPANTFFDNPSATATCWPGSDYAQELPPR